MPFYHFVGAPTIVIDSYLLDYLCGRYHGNAKFVIGGKKLTYTWMNSIVSFQGEPMRFVGVKYKDGFYNRKLHSYSLTWLDNPLPHSTFNYNSLQQIF